MRHQRIPLIRPDVPPLYEIPELYSSAVASGQYSNFGENYKRAQELLSKRTRMLSLPVTNGTLAVQIALQACLPRGARIAICDFTFIATMSAVYAAGMIPVLVGAAEEYWTINHESLWNRQDEFDAFIVTCPFGYYVNFALYDEMSSRMNKPVIYDCAGGFGMQFKTSNPVTYSFHATKNLGIGEGGAVCFASSPHYERAQKLINFDFDSQKFPKTPFGTNGKLDELRSAMLVAALKREKELNQRIEKHKHLIVQYQNDLKGIVEPHIAYENAAPQLAVLVSEHAEDLTLLGASEGIEFRRYYYPLLSDVDYGIPIRVLSRSPKFFNKFIAFPSDPIGDEYGRVVEFVKRTASNAKKTLRN